MASIYYLLLFIVVASCQDATPSPSPPTQATAAFRLGDVRNCGIRSSPAPHHQMEVLPGIGFDSLRDLDMGQVHAHNFSTCSISRDGKYLLPDNIFMIPVRQSEVEKFAEYFDHWDSYISITSKSMNVHNGFTFSDIAAKFSADYSSMKSHMYNSHSQSKSTRVQIRHKLYTIKIQPGAALHPIFKSRIFDIAASIHNNNTENARYLAELIVRDYGTHYVSSMDAGAVIAQVDFIQSSDRLQATVSSSSSFFKLLGINIDPHNSSSNNTKTFANNQTYSKVITAGGPPFSLGMTLAEWERGVPDHLVAIDRSGNPLHFVINPTTLPSIPKGMVRSISDYVYKAIDRYYRVNTHHGCTDPSSKNFNFQANINDHTCSSPDAHFAFGGIYQTCTVDVLYHKRDLCNSEPLTTTNPLTGGLSCPEHYIPVLLSSGSVQRDYDPNRRVCKHCHLFGLGRCCRNLGPAYQSVAHYQAYWCAPTPRVKITQHQHYLFGGLYTSRTINPITKSKSCPRSFIPLQLCEDINICVSDDYEQGYAYSVDFGGFESCSVGNPIATNDSDRDNWPHNCPNGFSQHLAAVEDGCGINYCVRAGTLFRSTNSIFQPKLPPFRKSPEIKYNSDNTQIVPSVHGKVWAKRDDGQWSEYDSSPEELSSQDATSSNNPDGGVAAGVSIGSIAAIIILGVIIVLVIIGAVKKYKKRKRSDYITINDLANDQGLNPANDPPSDSPTSPESV